MYEVLCDLCRLFFHSLFSTWLDFFCKRVCILYKGSWLLLFSSLLSIRFARLLIFILLAVMSLIVTKLRTSVEWCAMIITFLLALLALNVWLKVNLLWNVFLLKFFVFEYLTHLTTIIMFAYWIIEVLIKVYPFFHFNFNIQFNTTTQ